MNLGIVHPAVRDFPAKQANNLDMVLLTNPLEQNSIFAGYTGKILTENGYLDPHFFEFYNSFAKDFSRSWFREPKIDNFLQHKGINVGSVLARETAYLTIGIIKAAWLFTEILDKEKPHKITFVGAPNSFWLRVARCIGNNKGIPVLNVNVVNKQSSNSWRRLRDSAKKAVRYLMPRATVPARGKGNIVFSSALKFAMPFLEQRRQGDYYIRDIFSLSAWRLSKKLNFAHLFPSQVCPLPDNVNLSKMFDSWADVFQHKLMFRGFSILDLVQHEMKDLFGRQLGYIKHYVDWLDELFQQINPLAAIVDEEVCLFNNVLVQMANARHIKTYCLLHGMPFDDIGTVPSCSSQILTWGSSSSEQLQEWGISRDKVKAVGAPQYENFANITFSTARNRVLRQFSLHPEQKLVVFGAQPFHTNERPDFLGNPMTIEAHSNMVKSLCMSLSLNNKMVLIIKAHPREDKLWFTKELLRGIPRSISRRALLIKQSCNTEQLLAASDLVVTMGSTVYFEALLMRKPVLFFDDENRRYFPRMGNEFLPLFDLEKSARIIVDLLTPHYAKQKLQRQDAEVKYHFHLSNDQVVRRILTSIGA
jgi:hypothetical protein